MKQREMDRICLQLFIRIANWNTNGQDLSEIESISETMNKSFCDFQHNTNIYYPPLCIFSELHQQLIADGFCWKVLMIYVSFICCCFNAAQPSRMCTDHPLLPAQWTSNMYPDNSQSSFTCHPKPHKFHKFGIRHNKGRKVTLLFLKWHQGQVWLRLHVLELKISFM